MAIISWLIECDECGREIDATQESFEERNGLQLCNQCANEETPLFNNYIIKWVGTIRGVSKVHAKNERDAKEKATNKGFGIAVEVTVIEDEPEWNIFEIEKE